MAKTRKITQQDFHARIRYGVCPCCGDYRLVKRLRMIIIGEREEKQRQFGGVYWTCGGPEEHKCYSLSETDLRETVNDQPLIANILTVQNKPTVVRRVKNENLHKM